ncbi:MAG: hypothetical protein DMG29_06335 [Acidobacteria bacterium]|nr:MAG: hypothetical protein DMG29_06335 [Acidobacteriota bacterium]
MLLQDVRAGHRHNQVGLAFPSFLQKFLVVRASDDAIGHPVGAAELGQGVKGSCIPAAWYQAQHSGGENLGSNLRHAQRAIEIRQLAEQLEAGTLAHRARRRHLQNLKFRGVVLKELLEKGQYIERVILS